MTQLVKVDGLKKVTSLHEQHLAATEDLGEVLQIRDAARATEVFADARSRFDIAFEAAVLRLKAERKAGVLLADLPRNPHGGDRSNAHGGHLSAYNQSLKEHDLSRVTAERWQKLAALKEVLFLDYLTAQQKRRDEERARDMPTAQAALRLLKESERETKRERNRQLIRNARPIQQTLKEPVSTLVLDPPWDWGDEGDVDQLGRATPIYATMPFEDLLGLAVAEVTLPDSHLYLWITNRSLPKGFALLEAWGFRYVTMLTWIKPSFGMGNYYRGQSEHVLFGVRGSLALLRSDRGTVFHAERPARNLHSGKPNEFYELVEECSPGPWGEGFGRKARPGWVVWGETSIEAGS